MSFFNLLGLKQQQKKCSNSHFLTRPCDLNLSPQHFRDALERKRGKKEEERHDGRAGARNAQAAAPTGAPALSLDDP